MKFMSLENVVESINGKLGAGEFHHITFVSNPKVKKGFDKVINKVSSVTIRTKLDYTHTKKYAEYLEKKGFIGERKEDVTYMIDKALKHNNHTNNDLFMIIPLYETFKTHYEDENGNEVSKEEVERICYKKTKSEDTPYVISVNARKIVEIH